VGKSEKKWQIRRPEHGKKMIVNAPRKITSAKSGRQGNIPTFFHYFPPINLTGIRKSGL
jgi:hypothetical protein